MIKGTKLIFTCYIHDIHFYLLYDMSLFCWYICNWILLNFALLLVKYEVKLENGAMVSNSECVEFHVGDGKLLVSII